MKKYLLRSIALSSLLVLNACSTMSAAMNPFYEEPSPEALLGEANDHALNGDKGKLDTARTALEAMASYRRAQTPQPNAPVIQPAVVRLMWVPDHLNKHNDLVPQHYYYLKVLNDRWAVTDAFELESQLGSKTDTGNMPYTTSSGNLSR